MLRSNAVSTLVDRDKANYLDSIGYQGRERLPFNKQHQEKRDKGLRQKSNHQRVLLAPKASQFKYRY